MKNLTFSIVTIFCGVYLLCFPIDLRAQSLPDSCKLNIGTNLGGLADYGTEIPFVNMMKTCRTWYSKDANNPSSPFDTQAADSMTYRSDGYPTHIPQVVQGRTLTQKNSTIWAITDCWKAGNYVVLFDGTGSLSFWGGMTNLSQVNANKYAFTFAVPVGSILEMTIDSSSIADPIRNIRVLHVDNELTYVDQPFNPIWLDKLLIFKSVRFMDWGSTNHWGQEAPWLWQDSTLIDWNERAKLDHYTWANNKGIPYEMMIKLLNDYDLNGWICVPHRASNHFIDSMAMLFHNTLEPQIELTVEYSNEIWNWMFGQTNWCNTYGCVNQNIPWPEGIVPYIQNCLDRWTAVYGADLNRIKRAVGLQTGWADVSRRIAYNMTPNSFDVIAPTYYFGLSAEADSTLDVLGVNASTNDIAFWARNSRELGEKMWLNEIKTTIADSLNKPMAFYEGGQHLTPTPFGDVPTYENALLAIQRDTAMYNLNNEWFDYIRTLQTGDEPLELMNFSFIGLRSARYGSWGILETMTQDTTQIYAPKYSSIIKNMAKESCFSVADITEIDNKNIFNIYPNPATSQLLIQKHSTDKSEGEIFDINGRSLKRFHLNGGETSIDVSALTNGVYIIQIETHNKAFYTSKFIKQ